MTKKDRIKLNKINAAMVERLYMYKAAKWNLKLKNNQLTLF